MSSMRPPIQYSNTVAVPPRATRRSSKGISVRIMRTRNDSLMISDPRSVGVSPARYRRAGETPTLRSKAQVLALAKECAGIDAQDTRCLVEAGGAGQDAANVLDLQFLQADAPSQFDT